MMKRTLKRILNAYFNSSWVPALVFLVLLGGYFIAAIPFWPPVAMVVNGLLVATRIALVGVPAASIWNLITRRWAKGVVNLLLLPACALLAMLVSGVLMFALV